MKIPLKPGEGPSNQAPYRISKEAQDTVQATLEYSYSHGLARNSTSEFAAPVTLAPKPDGTWRFCIDYRKLNASTYEAKYPLPRIDDCLDRLGDAKYFSKLDLRSGYWQVRILPESIERTAFRTQYGHHEWLVMPFGLQGAPSTFQRMMNHYLRDFLGKFVLCYLDDILIYHHHDSKTKEEHLEHIEKVLQVLRQQQLFAKGSKCDFFKKEVQFLGFVVCKGQVDKDPAKVEAVREWPEPTNVREIRSFLGMSGFYRRFVQNYAQIAKPLTNILKSTEFEEKFGVAFAKKAPVSLKPEEQKAFESLKSALINSPCLVIFDPTKPTEVWADASFNNSTIGAVLMQDHGKGMQPVMYLSKVLNSPQSRYPTWEQELLGLYLAFEEWRHYLLPLHFTARTDHNGLKYIKTQKNLKERQWHWLAFFSEFHFDLQYRPGKQMAVPDSLSRKPHTETDIQNLLRTTKNDEGEPTLEIEVQTGDGKTKKVLFQLKVQSRATTKKKVVPQPTEIPQIFEYQGDPDYGKIFEKLTKEGNNPDPKRDPSLGLYSLRDGNLVWIDKSQRPLICVPKRYRALLLQEYHDTPLGGHFGIDKTFYSLRQKYIWPSMLHHTEQFVRSCDACQKNKASHQRKLGTPQIPELPSEPWERMSVDYCGPFPKSKEGNDYIVGFVCNLVREAIVKRQSPLNRQQNCSSNTCSLGSGSPEE
eukprot:503739-Rhodomonas_salina.1